MGFKLQPRGTQTKVKHLILERYLKSWGGIIITGIQGKFRPKSVGQSSFRLHFVYVDTHAYVGRYDGEQEEAIRGQERETVFGSPIIGVQALDSLAEMATARGIPVITTAVILEKRKQYYRELLRSLEMAGLGGRLKYSGSFSDLKDGEIAIINADSTQLTQQLLSYTQDGRKFAFFFIDPWGPIPSSFVHPIISRDRHDCIIYMPYLDLGRKAGCLIKDDRTSAEEKHLQKYDDMFGHTDWREIALQHYREKWMADLLGLDQTDFAVDSEALEKDLAMRYAKTLQTADQDLTIKQIPLQFADRDRTIYYLYLTTHDPTGALVMNQILYQAGIREHELRWRFQQSKIEATGQLPLFNVAPPPPPISDRPSKERVAAQIMETLSGTTLTLREVYRAMADKPYFAKEIQKGIQALRKENRCSYNGKLRNNTVISFVR